MTELVYERTSIRCTTIRHDDYIFVGGRKIGITTGCSKIRNDDTVAMINIYRVGYIIGIGHVTFIGIVQIIPCTVINVSGRSAFPEWRQPNLE